MRSLNSDVRHHFKAMSGTISRHRDSVEMWPETQQLIQALKRPAGAEKGGM
jgi:hypothetical protein